MRINQKLVCSIAMAVALAFPATSQAISFQMMTDHALAEQAEGAARVRVIERVPAKDGDQYTAYVVEVFDHLYGEQASIYDTLILPGTFDAPNLNMMIPGVPKLESGQVLLLFYNRNQNGALTATELNLGIFFELNQGGQRIYTRMTSVAGVNKLASANDRYFADRNANRFDNWLLNQAPAREPDYLVQTSPLAKFTFLDFGSGNRARYFEFDSDQVLQWRAEAGGQSGMTTDPFAQLQSALAAWTNDTGSRIHYGYAGTGTQGATFGGNVIWNADLSGSGGPAGPYDCMNGGTLAIGGLSASTPLTAFNGGNYFRGQQAVVRVRQNAGCFMDGSGGLNGAELLTHETGHALGFSHSCGDSGSPTCGSSATFNAAIMRASAHGNRGAVLGDDDRAIAALAYPNPPGTNVGPTLAANSPANNSTTAVAASGALGEVKSINITFTVSGGAGTGTTALVCTASGGNLAITSGTPQNSIAVGGNANPVVAAFTLTAAQQTGTVNCTATPTGGTAANFSYTLTAPAGNKVCGAGQSCVFLNGFE